MSVTIKSVPQQQIVSPVQLPAGLVWRVVGSCPSRSGKSLIYQLAGQPAAKSGIDFVAELIEPISGDFCPTEFDVLSKFQRIQTVQ